MTPTSDPAAAHAARMMGVVALLATALALYLGWFVTPLGDSPDEVGHYSYVYAIATGDLLPLLGESPIVGGLWGDDRSAVVALERHNYIVQHPPLYYWVAALPHAIADGLGADPAVLYRLPRVISALALGGLLLTVFSTLRMAGVAPARALPVTAGLAFLPMLVQLASGTTNDVFLFLLCALATRSMVRFVLHQQLSDGYLAALWLGLAGGTKMTAWVFIAPALAILIYEHRVSLVQRLRHGAGMTALALALPVAWMLRNVVHFGTPFYREGYEGLSEPVLQAEQVPFTRMLADEPVMNWLFAHFHGLFGFSGYCQTPALRHLCDGVEMTQLFGFARNSFTLAVAAVVLLYLAYLVHRLAVALTRPATVPGWTRALPLRAGWVVITLLPGLWAGGLLWASSMVDFGSGSELTRLSHRLDRWGGALLGLLGAGLGLAWLVRRYGRHPWRAVVGALARGGVPLALLLAVLAGLALGGLIQRSLGGQTLGDLQLLVMSALLPVGLLAGGLALLQREPGQRLGLYGPLVLLFFGGILLFQIYQAYLMVGIPRGVQGRYLYPVIPLLLVSLGVALERLRVPAALCLAVLVVLGLGFADAFVERALPFYLEVRL